MFHRVFLWRSSLIDCSRACGNNCVWWRQLCHDRPKNGSCLHRKTGVHTARERRYFRQLSTKPTTQRSDGLSAEQHPGISVLLQKKKYDKDCNYTQNCSLFSRTERRVERSERIWSGIKHCTINYTNGQV